MTTSSEQASAKIYQFPARGRFAANGVRGETAPTVVPEVVHAVASSGWYHEAAIEDAERARKV